MSQTPTQRAVPVSIAELLVVRFRPLHPPSKEVLTPLLNKTAPFMTEKMSEMFENANRFRTAGKQNHLGSTILVAPSNSPRIILSHIDDLT